MDLSKKFQNKVRCVCNVDVIFEIVDDIECDWGIHTVIRCPRCEELFSIDVQCPAFQCISKLLENNPGLYSEKEKLNYLSDSHHQ